MVNNTLDINNEPDTPSMFQTNRLFIVGGPSTVGKSTLLNKIRQGEVPNLCDQLSIELPSSYLYLDASELLKAQHSPVNRLVLHYDFVHQYSPKIGFPYLSDLINRSCNVNVLTLCTSSCLLSQRITSRLMKALFSYLRRPNLHNIRKINRLWTRRKLFRSTTKLFAIYNDWFEFIEECGVTEHLILDPSGSIVRAARLCDGNEVKYLLKGEL